MGCRSSRSFATRTHSWHDPVEVVLEQLEALALQSNPTLAQAVADIQAAEGRMIQAGLYPNPSAGYTGQQIGAAGAAGQQGFFVEQSTVRGRKLKLGRCAGS